MHMKKSIFCLTFAALLVFGLVSCKDSSDDNKDNEGKDRDWTEKINFSDSDTYVLADLDGSLWADSTLMTAWFNIPDSDNPQWFDVVLANDDINSPNTLLIRNYFYMRVRLPQSVKAFESADTAVYNEGITVLYYENKTTQSEHVEFSLRLTSKQGQVVITHNDGEYVSGYFQGTLVNSADATDFRQCKIKFNRIKVELIDVNKKLLTELQ